MKVIILALFSLLLIGYFGKTQYELRNIALTEKKTVNKQHEENIKFIESHYLVESAKKQIGVVTKYDTGYYKGGYPPEGQGACTDVIDQALRDNGYDLKIKIDEDMKKNPGRYQDDFDSNINFRRVRNVKLFLDNHSEKISTCTTNECLKDGIWKAGDIVTFDQIPGSLWHIAIVSNKTQFSQELGVYIPLLIHNYGRGTVEDNMLLNWPAKITGHYRL